MTQRFNPPPGWPVHPGWTPGPGFEPDPSWPPAPPGWLFWVIEETDDPVGFDPAAGQQFGSGPTSPNRNALMVAVVVLAAVVVAGAAAVAIWRSGDHPAAGVVRVPDRSHIEPSNTVTVTQTATVTTGSAAPSFAVMRDFVTGYYAELPANINDAWTKLDTGYADRTGFADYQHFWSGVRSVSVLSVSPRDDTSVVATLQYVLADGGTSTEQRWFSVSNNAGVLRIYDSGVVG